MKDVVSRTNAEGNGLKCMCDEDNFLVPKGYCELTMWQCMSQAPGLSVGKAIAIHPPPGRNEVSRRGGFLNFKVEGEASRSNTPWPCPRT